MASPSRGLFASLRRFLPSRRRAPRVVVRPTPAQPPPAAPLTNAANLLSAQAASHPGDANNIPEQPVATEARPAPPKEEEQFEDVDDEEDSEGDGEQADRVGDGVMAMPGNSKAKKKAKRRTTWVRKLLNQESAAPKDRVHRKKRKPRKDTESGLRRCHVIHTRAVDEHLKLLGCVMNFLEPLQPARRCAAVNKVWAAAVAQYYTRYCTPPRPYAFLKQFMFNQEHAKNGLLRRTLGFLSVPGRIHVSETSHVFQKVADSLSLAFIGSISANRFLTLISYDRINVRFPQTRKLEFDRVSIVDTTRILRYMSESDDEHFVSVTELVFKRLRGIADEKQFFQLIQALFSDSISRQLERLVLSDMSLEDMHFRHLARLFYDGRFPALQHLDISKNAFSSRFMRDWLQCFHEDRFQALRALDISDVWMGLEDMQRFFGGLRTLPLLEQLHISNNYCDPETTRVLSCALSAKAVPRLQELSCSGIFTDASCISILLDGFRDGACSQMETIDLSGNPVVGDKWVVQMLTQALSGYWWPNLRTLNLAFMNFQSEDVHHIANALSRSPQPCLRRLELAGNDLGSGAMEHLVVAIEHGGLPSIEEVNLAETNLRVVDFELLANSLSEHCPRLQILNLSGNHAGGDGIARFRPFLTSASAERLVSLDLSANEIPSHSLTSIADTLFEANCVALHALNLARNGPTRSLVRFQQLIRSHKCPSLACLQVSYAQSESEGYAFVRHVRAGMSVEELRRRKQLKFEERMRAIEANNRIKACRAEARCKRQCRCLREMYDHMESEADRALRRRKRVRKSTHLLIHEEIQRLKQDKYHERVCRELERKIKGNVAISL